MTINKAVYWTIEKSTRHPFYDDHETVDVALTQSEAAAVYKDYAGRKEQGDLQHEEAHYTLVLHERDTWAGDLSGEVVASTIDGTVEADLSTGIYPHVNPAKAREAL